MAHEQITAQSFFTRLAWTGNVQDARYITYLRANDLEHISHGNGFSFVSAMAITG